MIVADTDVLIDYLLSKNGASGRVAALIENAELCTTALTLFEIMSGVRSDRQSEAARELFEKVPALPLDDESAARAAEVRRHLERKGIGIGIVDSLIAGVALTVNRPLLTRNRRHFERVEGLVLAALH